MEAGTQHIAKQEEEISLKKLILRLQDWKRFYISKWMIISILALSCAGLGALYSNFSKPAYAAETTFIVEEQKSSSLGAYAGLASQLGLDLGGNSGTGLFGGDNVLAFLQSKFMVQRTLLSEVAVKSNKITLADLYINDYNLHDKWSKKAFLKNISYPVNIKAENLSLIQDSILTVLYKMILKKNLVVTKPDKKLSFINVTTTSNDEIFSKEFNDRLVIEATEFYVQTKTQKSSTNVNKLQAQADSIEQLLNKKIYSVAASQDFNLNPVRKIASVGTEVGTRDKVILQTIYTEVVKNLEISKMSMLQETPIIQVVDAPTYPLEAKRTGLITGIVIGAILGAIITIGFLTIVRMYRLIMN